MEKEIIETYYFNHSDYNADGKREKDGVSFRDVVKNFERNFHQLHPTEYAMNLYANKRTMDLLSKSCNAAPFLSYGMDLCNGNAFNPQYHPLINHQMDKYSKYIFVYGIDSAFMTDFDEHGYPILNEDSEIYPLTLLIDGNMKDGTIKLGMPTTDDDEPEQVTTDVPQIQYA